MKYFSVNVPDTRATLDIYLKAPEYEYVNNRPRPFMLVIPGGGYSFIADREAEPIAVHYLSAGYHTAVLNYSIRATKDEPFLFDTPLQEAAAAVRYVREHAEEWGVDPNRVSVIGFSAGGHLAASLGVLCDYPDRIPEELAKKSKPNAMVLNYPVITAGEFAHHGSINNLCGIPEPTPERAPWSIEKFVTKDTCPTFIWHTVTDRTVPVENSLMMAEALRANGVEFDLHLFHKGGHGLSLATKETGTENPYVANWFNMSLVWLNEIGVGPGYIG